MSDQIVDMFKHKREKVLKTIGYTKESVDAIMSENEATEHIDTVAMMESTLTHGKKGGYDAKLAKHLLSRKMEAMSNTFALKQAEFEAGLFDEFLKDDESTEN